MEEIEALISAVEHRGVADMQRLSRSWLSLKAVLLLHSNCKEPQAPRMETIPSKELPIWKWTKTFLGDSQLLQSHRPRIRDLK